MAQEIRTTVLGMYIPVLLCPNSVKALSSGLVNTGERQEKEVPWSDGAIAVITRYIAFLAKCDATHQQLTSSWPLTRRGSPKSAYLAPVFVSSDPYVAPTGHGMANGMQSSTSAAFDSQAIGSPESAG